MYPATIFIGEHIWTNSERASCKRRSATASPEATSPWTAVELWHTFEDDVGVSLIPVGGGHVDGELLYDKKALGVAGPNGGDLSQLRLTIHECLETAKAALQAALG
jgi:hypothetical protein